MANPLVGYTLTSEGRCTRHGVRGAVEREFSAEVGNPGGG